MIVRMLEKLGENFISIKKDIETIKKNQSETKNTILEMRRH